jgi:hypothetical protein
MKLKGDALGGACETNGKRREMDGGFVRKLTQILHLEELDMKGRYYYTGS